MNVNRNYKDSVFSFIFSNPDTLRELYCALKGVTLPDDTPININTLNDVIFKERINDISFTIDDKLIVLIEHQSTINPNITLRLLMYIARLYEKIIPNKKIYSSKKISIPKPEFFVLYNGDSPCPDQETLKLSELFKEVESLGLTKKDIPLLELEAKIININEGKNEAIVKKCEMLAQYSVFIAKVKEYINEGLSTEEAIKEAVKYCCEHGIMKEFMEEHAKEIMNMLITEWNWDDAKEVWKEEAREEGREEGSEKRAEEIVRNALAKGLSFEMIHDITGLSSESIKELNNTN
jgi:predicted transposase/invertase (TIGR01784 family)